MTLSTHRVEVVPIQLTKHPNADTLSVAHIWGFSCVVKTADWTDGQLAAYIPPDSLVDTDRPEFAFLKSGDKRWARIKAKKLRGVVSFGLLIPAPPNAKAGDDVAEFYGVTHYSGRVEGEEDEPASPKPRSLMRRLRGLWYRVLFFFFPRMSQQRGTECEQEKPPAELACLKKYDIDALRRYKHVFAPGEPVYLSEKLHGANARYAWIGGRLWAGSRSQWKREAGNSIWWKAAKATPQIEEWCRAHPGHVLYGEVYGQVQSLKYGTKPGEFRFAAFDILTPAGEFVDADDFRHSCALAGVPMVPLIRRDMPFDFEQVAALAEGKSTVPGADHVREGVVVRPMRERYHAHIGRVCLKVVGAGYLEKD